MIRRPHLLALLGGLFLAACDSGPDFGPPDSITKSVVDAAQVVGATIPAVTITVKDAEGRAVRNEEVLWAADAGGTVSAGETRTDDQGVATTAWTLGTAPGAQSLTATVGTLGATFAVNASVGPLSVLDIDAGGRIMHAIGDTLHLAVIAEDQFGNPVSPAGITWSSLDPGIATVAGGVVTSVAEGSARMVASSASFADTAAVAVDQIVAGLGLTPASPRVLVKAESLDLAAVPVDSNGVAVDTTVTVTWTTSAASVATVDASGLVYAVEVGDAVITATAGALTGQASLRVKTGPRPEIASIAPAVASPGDTLTITGNGFSATAGLNAVAVAGTAATVLTASPTQLTAVLGAGSLPCAPTADVAVSVTVDELEASTTHPLAGAERHSLAVGQSVTVSGPAAACTELDQAGRYIVSVFNATTSPGASTSFRLRGTSSTSVAAAPAGSLTAVMDGISRQSATITPTESTARVSPEEEAHARILDMNIDLLRRLGAPERTAQTSALRAASAVPVVGQIMAMRIPDIDSSNACTGFIPVNARVVHVGQYGVVLEDTLAPLAGETDALWTNVGQEYDAVMHQILLDNFGDPLVLDSQLDGNGKLLMLFSREVNNFDAGVAGFVFSGDFYPRSQCPSSDQAEIFYGIVPTSAGTDYSGGTANSWRRTMRSTVIHEVKHITSFASRIDKAGAGGPSWEDSWLEEATARLSEEFYGRARYGYGHNGNTDYPESVYCEVRPTGNAQCGEGSPYIMAKHFFALHTYYSSIETLTPLGRVDAGDATFYGSGWLFVRWALDQSGANEATFIKALVGEPTLSGVQNLAARTGRTHAQMLGDFSLAIAVDDRPAFTPASPAITMPSWDTRGIFQGMYDDFDTHPDIGDQFDAPFPLEPRPITFGDFQRDVTRIQSGTASIFELSGTLTGTQLIELLSSSGGTAPSSLGIAIVRVQ